MLRALLLVGSLGSVVAEPAQTQLSPLGGPSAVRFAQIKQLEGGDPLAQLSNVKESVFCKLSMTIRNEFDSCALIFFCIF